MTLVKNHKILLVPLFACLILILKLLSPMTVFAYYDPVNFGPLTLESVMELARNQVQSQSGFFGGSYTDYYTCSHWVDNGVDRYYVVFYNTDTITMTGTSPFIYNNNNGIHANLKKIVINIDGQNGGRVTGSAGGWTSYSNVYYAFVTGCYFTNPTAPGNFFSTITINCPNAPQYSTTPTVTYKDDLWAYKDGYSIKFGVNATLNSMFSNTYFVSKEYTAEISAVIGSTSYTVFPTSYAYYGVTQVHNIITTGDETKDLYSDRPYLQYWKKMRSVKVNKYEYPPTNPPTAETLTLTNSVTYNSENEVTLNTLLTAFQQAYPSSNFTIEDMQTEFTLRIKSDSKVELTEVFDFSPLQGESALTEIPPDENGTPNQFDPYEELNNNISSNNYYLKSVLIGEQYQSNGMSDLLKTVPDNAITNFEVPEVELEDPDFDSDTLSWFRRVVEWWYSSPFGFIAIAALTFLIIRTIVW